MKVSYFQNKQEGVVVLQGKKYAVIKSFGVVIEAIDGSEELVNYKTYLVELPSWVNENSVELFVEKHRRKLIKELKLKAIDKLTVTTENGNEFDANDKALSNMTFAIKAAEVLNITEHQWKLADNTIKTISLDELKEALALGIQAKGAIVLADDIDL